jgi:hypothetical protein
LLIERAIVNKLFKRLGIPYPIEDEFNFTKYVSFARDLFLNGQTDQERAGLRKD